MKDTVLNRFEHRRSIRKIERRGNTLYVECLCCHIMKPKSEFSPHSCSTIGVVSYCKKCKNNKFRQRIRNRRARLAV